MDDRTSTTLRRCPSVIAVALCALSVSASALGDTAAPAPSGASSASSPQRPTLGSTLTGEAKAEYDAALIVFGDGDYAGALLKFRRAYDLSKDGRLLWNVAVCEKNLRRYAKVRGTVEQYLAEAKGTLSAEDRQEAADLLEAVQGFVSPLWVTTDPDGATVAIDDEAVGTTPLPGPVFIDIGQRKIRTSKIGYVEQTDTLTAPGRTEVRYSVRLEREVHEGRVAITTERGATIALDGKVMGGERWSGVVASGGHTLRVQAPGKRTYQAEILVRDRESREIQVTLDPETTGIHRWVWIAGGAAVLTASAIGGYLLLKPKDEPAPPIVAGTIQPGSVQLSFPRR